MIRAISSLAAIVLLAGCGAAPGVYRADAVAKSGEPGYVTVQHVLIAFDGTGTSAIRSMEEAHTLAHEILEKAKAGADFDQLVRDYTDDSPPGIYQIANDGMSFDKSSRLPSKQVWPRSGLVAAFGNVGFALEVDEVGLAEFDKTDSPFGWHIVKRIR